MDINDLRIPGQRSLDSFHARHPWNHNEHFHGWILRNLPARRGTALDIGCGTGVLAGKLAMHFAHVKGIDRNEGMAAAASARLGNMPQVTIRQCSLAEFTPAAGDAGADLITMVAVLHHLDLDDTMARLPSLLAPGGRLLVVGLARPHSPTDLAFHVASEAANLAMAMIKHPRPVRLQPHPQDRPPIMPVRDPTTTLAEITATAKARLPGSTIRRRLSFRYTLRWDNPQ